MKKIIGLSLMAIAINLSALAASTDLPIHEKSCETSNENLYIYEKPEIIKSFPIVIVIDGSYSSRLGIQPVSRLLPLSKPILNAGFAFAVLERRGISKNWINKEIFHKYNTPSQRLSDHIGFISHLKKINPPGWNGKIFVIGGSEGGPIAVKLAKKVRADRCVVIVGCGDQTFKEYIWETIEKINTTRDIKSFLIKKWCKLPKNRTEYESRCEIMKKNPSYKKWWFGQTFLYWADALAQKEIDDFLLLDCPTLVITGSKDIEAQSTQRLIKLARKNNQDVTYICIDGMGHRVLNPKWKVMENVISFLNK